MFNDPLTHKMANFIKEIGIEVIPGKFDEETLIPGIKVAYGKLVVDEDKLKYPGDLLHEAGHLAVMPAYRRLISYIDVGNDPAEEMMAIAWSYAALVKLDLPPEVVFHPYGYKGDSSSLIDSCLQGDCPGLPMLQWLGMSYGKKGALEAGVSPFPNMIKWLRE